MSAFTLYPAVDLRRGRVVRLQQGDPARQTEYSSDPAGTARRWLEAGARWLHVVNLDGAFGEGDSPNLEALRAILKTAEGFGAQVQFGGGLRSLEAIEGAFELGVGRAVLGTLAVEAPQVAAAALGRWGAERIAVGIDARDGRALVRGWKSDAGLSATSLALEMKTLGLRTVVFTDVGRDGLGSGLNLPAARQLAQASGLQVIASGGLQALEELRAARRAGLAGAVLGRALYEGTLDFREALGEGAHAG